MMHSARGRFLHQCSALLVEAAARAINNDEAAAMWVRCVLPPHSLANANRPRRLALPN
jgi:hypothetical protein